MTTSLQIVLNKFNPIFDTSSDYLNYKKLLVFIKYDKLLIEFFLSNCKFLSKQKKLC